MSVWFTSDTHFGHRLVAGLRGFDNPDDHNEALIENFNALVKKGDQVWFLGDMSSGSPKPVWPCLDKIPGEHHLILGNHDRPSPVFRDAHKWHGLFAEHFASVAAYARRRVMGLNVMLSHYPYATDDGHADRGPMRYDQHRLPDLGDWLLHGHTHMAEQRYHADRQIHVGLDAWGLQPVHLDTVTAIIRDNEED